MQMIFASKYHGYGNDFLIVPADQFDEEQQPRVARALCNRKFGVGADGCLFLSGMTAKGFPIKIFNQDGSLARMSGNGTRCAAAYIHHRNMTPRERITFLTDSGVKTYDLESSTFPTWHYRSQMGEPDFRPVAIPFKAETGVQRVVDEVLLINDESIPVNALSVGNPQCVVFCEHVPHDEVFHRVGRALSVHPAFPDGTNVAFVHIEGDREIRIRIWERGVGPTHSSGTGSCGAAVMALALGKVQSPVKVVSETGHQIVEWEPGQEISLTGQAAFVADFHYCWSGASSGKKMPACEELGV